MKIFMATKSGFNTASKDEARNQLTSSVE